MPLAGRHSLSPQAIGSSTFTPPPFDATFGLHEIYDFHLESSSTHPLFIWESESLGLQSLTWGDVARGSHRAAHFVTKHAQTPIGNGTPPVVALLAFTDTVTSVCLMLGVIRAGYQCFCISPRNSVAGVRHLLETVGASELIVPVVGPLKAFATAALAESAKRVHVIPLPGFRDIFPENATKFKPFVSKNFKGLDTPAIIMHSSGSTSFPKPCTFSHRFLIQQSHVPLFGQVDLCNEILAVQAVPMFHAQGLFSSLLPLSTGMILGIFPPDVPTSLPTPERLLQAIVATSSTLLITVPSFLHHWAQSTTYIRPLSRLKAIFCGGAQLNEESKSVYRRNGVQIMCYLAATEYGITTTLFPKRAPSEGPEWFTISPHLSPVFIPQDEPNVYELVFPVSSIYTPAVINTRVGGRDGFATGDLVTQSSSNLCLWKIHGRSDDQIALSTGEKTNPGPIESIITCSPYIKACIVFGQGKFQNGIIVEPTDPFDPSDFAALFKFRNSIWHAVDEANMFAPSHSRIFKEMIIVSHPSKPFEYTLKNTPKRQLVLANYQAEIETTYAGVSESTQEEIPPPTEWDSEQTLKFVREVVSGVLILGRKPLRDDDDLFLRGVDSLQTTWIRNSILRALRESSDISISKEFSYNFVYEHPTVSSLASYLVDAVDCQKSLMKSANMNLASRLKRMEDLVVKYTQNFPERAILTGGQAADAISGEVVVLTGSTGSLGSQLLVALVQDPGVTRIYALNRQGVIPAMQRQVMTWDDQDLDPLLLRSDKIIFAEFNASEGLGLSNEIYEAIRISATLIIHSAWTMDFNLRLPSFEPNIQLLKDLIDLALRSPRVLPPRFIFTSTVGVLCNLTSPRAVPEASVSDMTLSVGTGYTESKNVAERILESCGDLLRIVVVRMGQLTGAPNGSWPTTEWIPALVKSGVTFGALPEVKEHVSWISTQTAALSLLEVAQVESDIPGISFVHLIHPHPVPWIAIFEPISEALGIPLVPYKQWLERLQKSAALGHHGPAIRLLDFFTAVIADGKEAGDLLGYSTMLSTEAQRKAPRSLQTLHVLGREDAFKWIGYWKRKGFL